MSDTIEKVPSSGGAPKVSSINEVVIRIAGNSQDGIQAIGGFLARLAGRSEQEVMTPATISRHFLRRCLDFPSAMAAAKFESSGDEADAVTFAFYQATATTPISARLKRAAS